MSRGTGFQNLATEALADHPSRGGDAGESSAGAGSPQHNAVGKHPGMDRPHPEHRGDAASGRLLERRLVRAAQEPGLLQACSRAKTVGRPPSGSFTTSRDVHFRGSVDGFGRSGLFRGIPLGEGIRVHAHPRKPGLRGANLSVDSLDAVQCGSNLARPSRRSPMASQLEA